MAACRGTSSTGEESAPAIKKTKRDKLYFYIYFYNWSDYLAPATKKNF